MEHRNSKANDEKIRKWCLDNGIKTHTVIPESFCRWESHNDIAKTWCLERLLFKDGTVVVYNATFYNDIVCCENPGIMFDLYNTYFRNQIVAAAFSVGGSDRIIEIEPVECSRAFEKDMFMDGYVLHKDGGYFCRYVPLRHDAQQSIYPFSPMHFYEYIEELKEYEKGDIERYAEKWFLGNDTEQTILGNNRIIEYEGNFDSTTQCRNYIIDNKEEWDGYIVRSYNGWDSDTIYRWQELANGKIIWRKEKA